MTKRPWQIFDLSKRAAEHLLSRIGQNCLQNVTNAKEADIQYVLKGWREPSRKKSIYVELC